ncbi:class I SAM-dependent methyltransferase [Heyndrickxia coagulans]|uniref:class I SAM-dependent methyltransferase n=1 Tax=Heyndrickxia coagulans TaxID=1398 RepID=UPI0008F86D8D|nr:class I SAM-dependent methyltransferase [Heyndrickxia coagulans]APB35388.1 SAM-dependent methyltransferase [Heyndrickxia coagulans]QPG54192.1 methyltransferase domain-containing protein [Heyndrickxia coagulans]UZH07667.1 methyltransferase domain-containing protein [Heyndrickxia coagulans]WNE62270.1 methyltransferase domain-containing protein [Heyndrickxia coagulans]
MGIDFHSKQNRLTYTTRVADRSWIDMMKSLLTVEHISNALDIGCGGGIYSKALADMGVQTVIGIDFSEPILEGAKENCKDYKNISFQLGNAYDTGLDSQSFQLVIERALIHHLRDLLACFKEAHRLLKDGGVFIIQDRTPDDCLLEGDNTNIRGYLFELFPKLIDEEIKRRHSSQTVIEALQEAGFKKIEEVKLWETRKVHENKAQLLKDISERTGRSILYELDDQELSLLTDYVQKKVTKENNIVEKDRWTIWKATI